MGRFRVKVIHSHLGTFSKSKDITIGTNEILQLVKLALLDWHCYRCFWFVKYEDLLLPTEDWFRP